MLMEQENRVLLSRSQTLIRENVNIDDYPNASDFSVSQDSKISIGDLHGSALKMLYFLQRHAVIEIPREEYLSFVKLYKIQKITSNHLDEFNRILESIRVTENGKNSSICFIGDDLCDRGTNDYFTLKFFERLATQGAKFEILVSNHSIEFLSCYEKKTKFDDHIFFSGQGRSSDNLQILIDSGLIERSEIESIMKKCYLPNLKLLSYSISRNFDNDMTLFAHAPVGLDILIHIASSLGLSVKEDWKVIDRISIENLSDLVDSVNGTFSKLIESEAGVYDLFKVRENLIDIMTGNNKIDPVAYPLAHLIWNRVHTDLFRPKHIFFVHGHDMRQIQEENVCNLDNNLGKGTMQHKGKYVTLYTHL